jgi:hypothetical protein
MLVFWLVVVAAAGVLFGSIAASRSKTDRGWAAVCLFSLAVVIIVGLLEIFSKLAGGRL